MMRQQLKQNNANSLVTKKYLDTKINALDKRIDNLDKMINKRIDKVILCVWFIKLYEISLLYNCLMNLFSH